MPRRHAPDSPAAAGRVGSSKRAEEPSEEPLTTSDSRRHRTHRGRGGPRGTREALYAELTTARIAAESSRIEAGLYYHYDSKDEMVAAFLDSATGYLRRELEELTATGPEAQLREACDHLFVSADDERRRGTNIAVMELLSHATQALCQHPTRNDDETIAEPAAEDRLFLVSAGNDRTDEDHRPVDEQEPADR